MKEMHFTKYRMINDPFIELQKEMQKKTWGTDNKVTSTIIEISGFWQEHSKKRIHVLLHSRRSCSELRKASSLQGHKSTISWIGGLKAEGFTAPHYCKIPEGRATALLCSDPHSGSDQLNVDWARQNWSSVCKPPAIVQVQASHLQQWGY